MDNDWNLAKSLFTLAIVLAIYITYLSRTITCEGCSKRISLTLGLKNLPCPHCGRIVDGYTVTEPPVELSALGRPETSAPDGQTGEPQEEQKTCAHCRSPVAASALVQLWDGEDYCRRCLQSEAPELLSLPVQSGLTEEFRYSVIRLMLRALPWALAWSVAGGFVLAVLVSVVRGVTTLPLEIVLYVTLGLTFIVVLFASLTFAGAKLIVSAWDRQLIVNMYHDGQSPLVAPLQACRWMEGDMSQITAWWSAPLLLRGRALIIELPVILERQRNRIAVGSTPESYQIWKQFLTLARVPRLEE